jgi:hypothetical protein
MDSTRNSFCVFLKYNAVKTTAQKVRVTGIIVSNSGETDFFSGKMSRETRKGIIQRTTPYPIARFIEFICLSFSYA